MPPETDDLPLFSKVPGDQARQLESVTRLRSGTALGAAIRVWAEELERLGRSEHTVKAFTGDLRLLAKFVGPGQGIGAIGTHDLKNFLHWMTDRRGVPCSPKTYSRRVTSIKAFFRWLTETGVLSADPAASVPQQTVLSPLPEVLTPQEVESVLEVAGSLRKAPNSDARPYTLLALLLETGIKKGECLAIHPNHVHLNAVEGPILFIRYGDSRKRYKERKLPLSADWIEAYREYLEQYEPHERLFPWSPRRLEYLLEEIGQAAGLEKHLSFDMCRWTAALADYHAGAERDAIRQKLGLSKIQWREVGTKIDRLAAKIK
jgi:site-specific recombinase XerD